MFESINSPTLIAFPLLFKITDQLMLPFSTF